MEIVNGKLVEFKQSDVPSNGIFENESVIEIADNVFKSIKDLKNVILKNCTTIGNDNFYNCNALASFEAPVTTMGNGNFYNCNALVSFEAPLTTMGNYNFYNCNALTSIKFKNNFLNTKNVDKYCYVIESKKTSKGVIIYNGYNLIGIGHKIINKNESFVAEKDGFTAHGKTIKLAISDLNFKIVSEKLKKEPIKENTVITIKHYRLLTGACEFGVNEWMASNNIKEGLTAKELLPILENTNAYGLSNFKKLITF